MAKRNNEPDPVSEIRDRAPEPAADPPMQYVRIVNLDKAKKDFALTDGTSVACGPKLPGMKIHISRPVLRRLIGPYIYEAEKLGRIRLEPSAGGDL